MLLIVAMGLCGPSWAQENKNETTVYVIGTGYNRGNDISATRQEAIENGLVMAVSRGLSDLMPLETMVGSFQVLNAKVLSHTDQFVQDYKVLTEATVSDTYHLLMQVTVSTRRLKEVVQKAGVRLGQIQYPNVLLCIAEKGVQDQAPRYWWGGQPAGEDVTSAALAKFLSGKGYGIVRPGSFAAANYPPELSAAEAVTIGKELKADIVITGMASVEEAANTTGAAVRSFRGTLNATAYRVSDGQPIAQVSRTSLMAAGDDISAKHDALKSAAVMVGEDLAPQISEAWFKQAVSTAQIEIVVQSVSGNIANFVKFRGALSNASGIENLQLKEMMAGAAVLVVAYQGSAQSLADAMLSFEFDSFGIDIENVEGNTIHMQLVPKAKSGNEEN